METPSINEILQNIQYRFKENLESNLTVIPTSQAALIIFATKVLTETVTEVAFDTLQHMISNKPFPFEVPKAISAQEFKEQYEQRPVPQPPAVVPTPNIPPSILYPWNVANVGHILAAYEVYPTMEVHMFTQDLNGAWEWYFTTRTSSAFQGFCNSMSKEDPTSRYRIATNPAITLVS